VLTKDKDQIPTAKSQGNLNSGIINSKRKSALYPVLDPFGISQLDIGAFLVI
jgi:hypothetical protein